MATAFTTFVPTTAVQKVLQQQLPHGGAIAETIRDANNAARMRELASADDDPNGCISPKCR